MSVATGRKIHSYSWKILLTDENVINRVNQLAIEEGKALIAKNFTYEWIIDNEIEDEGK